MIIDDAGTFRLGSRSVRRLGYGAMQLAGPGVFGPPRDQDAALAVLREAVASGVDHIDTSDFCGPHVTNQLIREALALYPPDLTLVTKVGARRNETGAWLPAFSRKELTQAVHDNCATRASTCWTSSICVACSARTDLPRDQSRRRLPCWPSCSSRA